MDEAANYSFLTRARWLKSEETIKWEDGNEYPLVKVQISSASHPFFTGEEKIIDTEGRVDRFKARAERAAKLRASLGNKTKKAEKEAAKRLKKPKQRLSLVFRFSKIPVVRLGFLDSLGNLVLFNKFQLQPPHRQTAACTFRHQIVKRRRCYTDSVKLPGGGCGGYWIPRRAEVWNSGLNTKWHRKGVITIYPETVMVLERLFLAAPFIFP